MSDEDHMDQLGQMLMGGAQGLQAIMAEAMAPERYEYRQCAWRAVNEAARDGWQLAPVPPVAGTHTGVLLYVMQRKLALGDALAAVAQARDAAAATHPGIRLRLRSAAGILIDADSDHLYYAAKFGGSAESCQPDCPPGCQQHGWTDLTENVAALEGCRIEIRPVELADAAGDES